VLINKGVKMLDATLDDIRERYDPRTIIVDPLDGPMNLANIAGVRDVQPMSESTKFEVEVDEGVDRQLVMREIVARGSVRGVELRRLTMDEVFVRVVKSGGGVEAAEIAREELSHV
jgi:ABC-type uncharacterized transport system ATPase subunit